MGWILVVIKNISLCDTTTTVFHRPLFVFCTLFPFASPSSTWVVSTFHLLPYDILTTDQLQLFYLPNTQRHQLILIIRVVLIYYFNMCNYTERESTHVHVPNAILFIKFIC